MSKESMQTSTLGKYAKLATVMLQETNYILAMEGNNKANTMFKNDVWKTCASKVHLQYGEEMLKNTMEDGIRQANHYYYTIRMENSELFTITVPYSKRRMITKETKLISTMIEEITHAIIGGLYGHDEVFVAKFTELWGKYHNYLSTKLGAIINESNSM
jgi:hypothetical protein